MGDSMQGDEPDDRLPVLLLAGFLGSGKTTLLNRLLTDPAGKGCAVLVNEFGEVPIDGKLVLGAEEDVVLLRNGCVCCTVRGDLVDAVLGLLRKRARRLRPIAFDRIVVEASGLASPGPVLQTLSLEDGLRRQTRAQGVVTLCHAGLVPDQLRQHPEAEDQVGYADLLLLNHADRADEAELDRARAALRSVNGVAPIEVCERAGIDPARVLALESDPTPRLARDDPEREARHTPSVRTLSLESDEPLDLHRLKMWLRLIGAQRDHELLRVKGWLRCAGRSEPVVVQGMHQWLEIGPAAGEAPRRSALVLIGRDLDEEQLRTGWRRCAPDRA